MVDVRAPYNTCAHPLTTTGDEYAPVLAPYCLLAEMHSIT